MLLYRVPITHKKKENKRDTRPHKKIKETRKFKAQSKKVVAKKCWGGVKLITAFLTSSNEESESHIAKTLLDAVGKTSKRKTKLKRVRASCRLGAKVKNPKITRKPDKRPVRKH